MITSRREFIELAGAGIAGTALASAFPSPASSDKLYAFVSCYTDGPGQEGAGANGGIHVCEVNEDGSLKALSQSVPKMNASMICVTPGGRYLYSTDQRRNGDPAGGPVTAFSISPTDGSLTVLNAVPSMGELPSSIAIDPAGKRIATANHGSFDPIVRIVKRGGSFEENLLYSDSTVSMYPLGPDGKVNPPSDVIVLSDAGHGTSRFQATAHAHSANFDPSGRFLLACDRGTDHIFTYHAGAQSLTPASAFTTPTGQGPRHSVFHKKLPYVYVLNELQPTLNAFSFDSSTGELRFFQNISTIPPGDTVRTMPADIQIHPNGQFLYSCNRGDNSIAIFKIDQSSGKLDSVGFAKTLGDTPRGFDLDPAGKFLYACHEEGGGVVVFAIDSQTGKLTPTGSRLDVSRPVCIKFARL